MKNKMSNEDETIEAKVKLYRLLLSLPEDELTDDSPELDMMHALSRDKDMQAIFKKRVIINEYVPKRVGCPFCDSTGHYPHKVKKNKAITSCNNQDCPIYGVQMTVKQWEKRGRIDGT